MAAWFHAARWRRCLIALLLLPRLALATRPAEDTRAGWHAQKWSSEQGLPQNNVRALVHSQAGFVWVGTLMGLARFDGLRFRVFTHTDTPELVSDTICSLAEDEQQTLWVGTQRGLIEFQDGVGRFWNTNHGFPASGNGIQQLQVNPRGGLWFRAGNTIGHFADGRAKLFGPADGLISDTWRHIYPSRRGGILVSSRRGLQRLEPDTHHFSRQHRWPVPSEKWCVLEDAAGTLWAGSENGLFRLEEEEWKPQGARYGIDGQWVTHLYQFRSGVHWVVTKQGGVQFLRENRFEPISPPGGHWHDVGAMCEDGDGNVWVGTGGGGLLRLRPTKIRSWTHADGLPHDDVRTLCAAPDGAIWAGTGLGLARIHHQRVEAFPGSKPGPRGA